MRKVAILGLGAWGSALAVPLTDAGSSVFIWGRRPDAVEKFNSAHENREYLPGVNLEGVTATVDVAVALDRAEVVILAVPTAAAREVCRAAAATIRRTGGLRPALVSTCKGLEEGTYLRISEVAAGEMGDLCSGYAVLSGPNFAIEVGRRLPTATVVACADAALACYLQDVLMTPSFRVYTNPDVVGVEVAGALKNVIALAVGMAEGLGLGYNARAALITRGLAEITRLGTALGADKHTFAGLAGMGDLVLTCMGEYSRNRRAGMALAAGQSLEEFVSSSRSLVEGAQTTRSVVMLARSSGVEAPVAEKVYEVLFEGRRPVDVVGEIMTRDKKTE